MAPLTLRDAGSCAQARTGEVALSVHSCEDLRHGSYVVGPLRALARGERSTKVRHSTLSGRNRRSLRVSGALSAVAAGDALVATARRGSGSVHLWHAEAGALAMELAAHEADSTVLDMALIGGLLLTAATDSTAALHAIGGVARSAWPSTATPPCLSSTDEPEARPAAAPPLNPLPFAQSAGAAEAAAEGAGGSAGGEIAVVEPFAAPRCMLRVGGHRGAVRRADLRGAWLLTGGEDARAVLWAAGGGGRPLRKLEGHRAPLCMARLCGALSPTTAPDG